MIDGDLVELKNIGSTELKIIQNCNVGQLMCHSVVRTRLIIKFAKPSILMSINSISDKCLRLIFGDHAMFKNTELHKVFVSHGNGATM